MNDLLERAEDRLIGTALAELLGGEEPGRSPEDLLGAVDAAPAARMRSPRGLLEVAAAALLLVFAAWGLPALLTPAAETRGEALVRILGEEAAREFAAATDAVGKTRVLADRADSLRAAGIGREDSLLLGDAILEAAPWREAYEDGEHQKDLFDLREIATANRMTFLGGLFARMASHPAPYVRLHAMLDLQALDAREFADAARGLRDDPDARVRDAALSALAAFGEAGAPDLLAQALRDPDDDVRRHAVAGIGDYAAPDGQVRAMVLGALADPDPGVRMAAADRVEREADRSALDHLRTLMPAEADPAALEVLASTVGSLELISGTRRPVKAVRSASAGDGGRPEPERLRILDAEGFAAVSRGLEGKPPDVDFPREMVIAIFLGRRMNCAGVDAEFAEDDERLYVRFRGRSYQTLGGADLHLPFALFVLPRIDKPVVFLEDTQGYLGLPPVWTAR